MKEYISQQEAAHCMQVKEIFQELSEETEEFCVVDAYPFGCVVLEWFSEGKGFDRQTYFSDASQLFDYLLETWEHIYLFEVVSDLENSDLDEQEALKLLSADQKKEMDAIRNEYIMQYESCQITW